MLQVPEQLEKAMAKSVGYTGDTVSYTHLTLPTSR